MTAAAQHITAVIVLYERPAAASEAFLSLKRIMDEGAVDRTRLGLILYDNSPLPDHAAAEQGNAAGAHYVHNGANGGLVEAYSYALDHAIKTGSAWLLLLDQDTTLIADYLVEMLETIDACHSQQNVAAVVPVLEMEGRIYSPELDYFYHVRHQFPWMRNYPLPRQSHGIQKQSINAYNSGAALRVSALQTIGGFPQAFRVDYLDHAVFRELQQRGFRIFVLHSVLQQKLSHSDLDQVTLARHTSVLQAQSLFVARYGKLLDRLLFRLWLLRKARHYRALCSDSRVWKGMVRQALGWWRLSHQEPAR